MLRHGTPLLRVRTVSAVLLLTVGLGLLPRCAQQVAGGSSEVGNPVVVGRLVDTLGQPASLTTVYLIAADRDPLSEGTAKDIVVDMTDADGRFVLHAPDSGVYNIQAERNADRTAALALRINAAEDSVKVEDDTLRRPGTLKIAIPAGLASDAGHFYLPGTLIGAGLPIDNQFLTLTNVPAGTLPPLYYAEDGALPRVMGDSLQVVPDSVTTIPMPGWLESCRISLNTTATGADVSSTVTDFPVLVRLNATNFDFSQAREDGGDLRFTKTDGTGLPHEIERWDGAGKQAEIWVKLDTILGNSDQLALVMYWGNPRAAATWQSVAVFDTAAGFQGVWHMAALQGNQLLDATKNRYNGTAYNFTTDAASAGMIGTAQQFNGATSYISLPTTADSRLNFPENGYYSLCAWVYLDTIIPQAGHVFISKGDYQYNLEIDRDYSYWHMSEFHDAAELQRVGVPAAAGVWKCVVGVREGSAMRLYLDGEMVTDSLMTNPNSTLRDVSQNVTFGRMSNVPGRFLDGTLDEVRIMSRALSADWIKLSYMNQRKEDALVRFER